MSVLLSTTQLTKFFGDTHAVDHVDFTVSEGEVLALIGSNGAGKTTLINLISGLIPVDSGRIVFQGVDITRDSIHEKIARGIARSLTPRETRSTLFDEGGCSLPHVLGREAESEQRGFQC